MATYVFRCPDCAVFEVVIPMSSLRSSRSPAPPLLTVPFT